MVRRPSRFAQESPTRAPRDCRARCGQPCAARRVSSSGTTEAGGGDGMDGVSVRPGRPASHRDGRPDQLDHAERPRPLQEAIGGPERARSRERQHEPPASSFERIADDHRGDREQAEERQEIHVSGLERGEVARGRCDELTRSTRRFPTGIAVLVVTRPRCRRAAGKEKSDPIDPAASRARRGSGRSRYNGAGNAR